jgi:hypothetical protein
VSEETSLLTVAVAVFRLQAGKITKSINIIMIAEADLSCGMGLTPFFQRKLNNTDPVLTGSLETGTRAGPGSR